MRGFSPGFFPGISLSSSVSVVMPTMPRMLVIVVPMNFNMVSKATRAFMGNGSESGIWARHGSAFSFHHEASWRLRLDHGLADAQNGCVLTPIIRSFPTRSFKDSCTGGVSPADPHILTEEWGQGECCPHSL